MIEYYTAENRDYDREMMISIEMVKYFIPLLEERGYQEKAQELSQRLNSLLGSESQGPSRLQRRD